MSVSLGGESNQSPTATEAVTANMRMAFSLDPSASASAAVYNINIHPLPSPVPVDNNNNNNNSNTNNGNSDDAFLHQHYAAAAAADDRHQQSQQLQQQLELNANANNAEPPPPPSPHINNVKRKRGRPRKYDAAHQHSLPLSLPLPPPPPPPPLVHHHSPTIPTTEFHSPPSSSSPKKARGRPPGSGRKNQPSHLNNGAAGLAVGCGFTPHIITAKAGEDVLLKIMSLSQSGPRSVCILSANGAISNVTLQQPATSGGTVTYQGRYEILSLSGSFLLSESGGQGQRSRRGGLSVSLAGSDGHVFGGSVAGLLTAASSVQVIVGSFISEDRRRELKLGKNQSETLYSPTRLLPGACAAGSPPSFGALSESSGGPGCQPSQQECWSM